MITTEPNKVDEFARSHRRLSWTTAWPGIGAGAFLLVLLALDQAHLVLGHMRGWVNEDHTILWYAARDLGQGRIRQPGFYGAAYFSVLEALPAELLRLLGVSLRTAIALSTACLMMGGWVFLALGAWRRRHPVLALLALAIPLMISLEFLVSAESPGGRAAGTFLTMVGVSLLVASPTNRRNFLAFTLLGSVGVVLDFGSAFLFIPAAAFAVVSHRRTSKDLAAAAMALGLNQA